VQGASEHARGRGIVALDGSGGEQELEHEGLAWRQVAHRRGPQKFPYSVVITGS
jgi:hypothetical protein